MSSSAGASALLMRQVGGQWTEREGDLMGMTDYMNQKLVILLATHKSHNEILGV